MDEFEGASRIKYSTKVRENLKNALALPRWFNSISYNSRGQRTRCKLGSLHMGFGHVSKG